MRSFKEIALAFAMIVVVYAATAFVVSAQEFTVGKAFGGYAATYVPPSPACAFGHQVIYDFVSNSVMGLTVLPGSNLYANFRFTSPGVFLLGTFIPSAVPCLLPYPIYPLFMGGTS